MNKVTRLITGRRITKPISGSISNIFGGKPSAGGAGGPDPYWANVKLLMGFEGVNGSTGAPGMNDESPSLRGTAGIAGTAKISTAQFKFGTSSLLLTPAGDYITFPDSNDWDFGTGPVTIEGWFWFKAVPNNAVLIAHWSGGWALYFEAGNLKMRASNANDTTLYPWVPTLNQWYHIAFDRDASNVARVYVDGIMRSKSVSWTHSLTGSTAVLAIGSLSPGGFGNYDLSGHLEELRITANVGRYGSDGGFPVPTTAYPRF